MTAARPRTRFDHRHMFGTWTSLGHPSITEIFARAGVDFIGVDLEHSTISLEEAQRIIAAAHAGGLICLPRVSSHNGEQIKRVLDAGADGIIVPNVVSRAEAEQLIAWCQYPPLGQRSYGVARAQGYGFEFADYVGTWNERLILLIQIESIAGVDAVDKILSVDGIGGVLVGPYDISGSLGLPGQLTHPRVTETCERVVAACRLRQKACGTQLVDPTRENIEAAFEAGYTFVILASDVFVLWKWGERMRECVRALRGAAAHAAGQTVA